MRLFSSEHQDITNLLDRFGLADKVLLVKKKGWIHIHVGGESISYHRKKITRIENGHFIDGFEYFIRMDQKERQLPDWNGVCKMLEMWLSRVSK